MRAFILIATLLAAILFVHFVQGQTPAPVMLQASAATTAAQPSAAVNSAAANGDQWRDMLQLLQQMEAENNETIKKQEAALATLDQLQKAAEEVKIFSKRG